MNAKQLVLYHFDGCPYCERVRAALRRLHLDVELRDIRANPSDRQDLLDATGRATLPCLRIEEAPGRLRWMHESADIIAFLEQEFGR